MGSRRTTWTSITLVAVATMILASALGVSALAALFFGTAVIAASTAARLLPRVRWSLVAWRIRGELRAPTGPALAAIIGAAVAWGVKLALHPQRPWIAAMVILVPYGAVYLGCTTLLGVAAWIWSNCCSRAEPTSMRVTAKRGPRRCITR